MTSSDEINAFLAAQLAALAPNVVTISLFADTSMPPQWRVSLQHDLSIGARGTDLDEVLARFRTKLTEAALPVSERVRRLRTESDLLAAEANRLEARPLP